MQPNTSRKPMEDNGLFDDEAQIPKITDTRTKIGYTMRKPRNLAGEAMLALDGMKMSAEKIQKMRIDEVLRELDKPNNRMGLDDFIDTKIYDEIADLEPEQRIEKMRKMLAAAKNEKIDEKREAAINAVISLIKEFRFHDLINRKNELTEIPTEIADEAVDRIDRIARGKYFPGLEIELMHAYKPAAAAPKEEMEAAENTGESFVPDTESILIEKYIDRIAKALSDISNGELILDEKDLRHLAKDYAKFSEFIQKQPSWSAFEDIVGEWIEQHMKGQWKEHDSEYTKMYLGLAKERVLHELAA